MERWITHGISGALCFFLPLICLSLVSAQTSTQQVAQRSGGYLELQPSSERRVEEQGRGFVVTCRIPAGLNGANLRWTQGSDRRPINEANGRNIQVMKRPVDKPTSVQLVFNNVSKADENLYMCLATIDGAEVQKEFQLTIYTGINYDKVELAQAADVGKDFTMTCDVQGEPKPSVTWRRAGESLGMYGHDKYTVSEKGLTIKNISRTDEGLYDCDATQIIGHDTSSFKRKAISLVVNYPPEFTNTEPAIAYAFLGGEVNLTCQADGEPSPSYDWGYDENGGFSDMPLTETKNRDDYVNPSRTTLVKNMTDQSQFRDILCRAKNSLGEVVRRYTVKQIDKPVAPSFEFRQVGGHRLELQLTPSQQTNNPLPTTGYRAIIRPSVGGAWENATVIDFMNGTRHVLDSLRHNTEYDIMIAARNAIGVGDWSDVKSVKTLSVSASTSLVPFTGVLILMSGLLLVRA
ncbi:hypothetical protein RvY_01218 [Ramazzottius varieornatus]|uniref:Uncharacterized protein n=1 Tax=Ramazzottius varieornatus TaxID=947166 RepID=A0A1D1UJH3_RAMVA|nr:hypothetical protein RvY_01218 [Ramazzottius varieornatus]